MINVDTGQQSSYFPLRINKSQTQEGNSVVPIKFPSTRNVLWESRPVGDFETLALILGKQVVQLFIVEKSLRLAHRYAEDRRLTSFLLGSVYTNSGDSGVCFGVDRFDPGREITERIGENVTKSKVPTAVVPGDDIIPITVKQELLTSDDSISHTKDEFTRAIQVLEGKICGKDVLTLSHVVSLKANLYCCRKQDELIIALHCGAIVPNSKFQARSIAPLPIIPTTLARNLAGPLRLSDVEGTPKMGYVTMDQTRKLLLLLQSDPKVYNLPLIGIWISGVHNVHHPYVWASCLRFLNCREIKDRVLHSSGSFLLLHYSIVQKIPDFWECFLDSDEKLDFQLLSCLENLHLDLDDCSSKEPLCFHLTSSSTGMNKVLFDEAMAESRKENATTYEVAQNADVDEDGRFLQSSSKSEENPRPSPLLHPSPSQAKTPNAPAPEESLSLSFDEGSNSFNKNNQEKTKENSKSLAPRFKQTPNPAKPVPNKANSSTVSRQPFKQITPQDQANSPNSFLSRGKPVLASRNQVSRKREDKENTPLTSKYVAQGNINQKSPCAGLRGNIESFSERNEKVLGSQSVGNHQRNMLADQNLSNRRVLVEITQVKKRKRYNSEEVRSCQNMEQSVNRTRANSHSSLDLSHDDSLGDISLDSSIAKNNVPRRLSSNQSPSDFRNSNQPSPKSLSKPSLSNSEYLPDTCRSKQPADCRYSDHVTNQSSKRDSCKLKHQSPRGDVDSKRQSNPNARQNCSNFSENVSSHRINENPEQRYVDDRSPTLSPHDVQCTTVNSKRQSCSGTSSRPSKSYANQRQVTEMVMRQPSPKNSDSGPLHVYHGNPHQDDFCDSFNSGNTVFREQKDAVKVANQPSNNHLHQQNAFAKSHDLPNQPSNRRFIETDTNATETKRHQMTLDGIAISEQTADTFMKADSKFSTKYHNQNSSPKRPTSANVSAYDYEEAGNKSGNCSHRRASNDTTCQISTIRVTNDSSDHSPGRYVSHQPDSELSSKPGDSVFANVESQTIAQRGLERQLKKEEKHTSNRELEEQVKRQEDMIRVLQEQVRSLLRMKESISSESDSPSLPLTPTATPVLTHETRRLSHCTSPENQQKKNTSLDEKQEPETVTIGVNTGASLLWETPQNGCEKCCKISQPEQTDQDAPDDIQPPEHPDVFPTPEKTESLINPSQVDVQADSTRSSTPAISDVIVPSMSAEGESLLNKKDLSTSQTNESAIEDDVPEKGREFYDKLLFQVKDLLSEQVSTKQQDDSTEAQRHSSQSFHAPTREVVVKATLKQLEKIKHSEQDGCQQSSTRLQAESSSVFSRHQRSLSTSFIPEHPRLNFVSMSVDDTFDEVTCIDKVALKYLSDEELKQFKNELRPSSSPAAAVKRSFTRTVRFGSLPSDNERRSHSRRNIREVDFTWNNLSFCTKDYLTKYNLVEGHVSFAGQDDGPVSNPHEEENSPETSIEPCKPPFPSPARHRSEESSHILDIKRLKNLPKLF